MTVLNVGQQVECVYRKGQGQGCLANLDLTNTVFVGHSRALDSSADTIPPLGSIIVDGSQDLYASTQSQAVTVRLQSTPGVTNWAPSPAQVAAQISALGLATATNQSTQITHESNTEANTNSAVQALFGTAFGTPNALVGAPGLTVSKDMLHANTGVTTEIAALLATGSPSGTPGGVPLLHGYQLVANNSTWTAAASGSFFSPVNTLAGPAYQFAIRVTISSAAASVPFPRVVLSFLTAASSGVKVDEVDFYVPATSAGSYWIYGAGPAPTPFVQVQIQNLDNTFTLSGQYLLGTSTLQRARHDWRSLPGGTVPGYNLPPVFNGNALLLGASPGVGTSVPANGQVSYLLPLYAGQAIFNAQLNITPNPAALYQVLMPTGVLSANNVFVFELGTTATFLTSEPFALPRCPCILQITNNNGVSAIVYNWGLVALEYAS